MMKIFRILNLLKSEIKQLFYLFVYSYPDSEFGLLIRKKYWTKKLDECGSNIEIRKGAAIGFPEIIKVGNGFILGNNAHITAAGSKGIHIGNNVSVSRGTYFHASNHKFDNLNQPIMKQGTTSVDFEYKDKLYSIIIEDDVWIGSNSVILTGTFLSKGCIVASGSIVSGKFDPYSIIGGNPARFIKKRQ